jgi:CspA family cold shock protein
MVTKTEDVGIINMYDPFRGLGFIRREKGKDVFFLFDELPDMEFEPTIGDRVTFEIKVMPKGPRAYKLKLVAQA